LKEFYVFFLFCFLKQNLNLPQICKEKKYKNVTSLHHEMQACNKQLTKPAPKIDKKKKRFADTQSLRNRSNISLKDGEMVFCYKKSWRHGFC